MELEQQVVSLELAKKLKELGVKQESLFCWTERTTRESSYMSRMTVVYRTEDDSECLAAFTVTELGEILPDNSHTVKKSTVWVSSCTYSEGTEGWHHKFEAPTEADARAKMLIYLLEDKLI